MILSVCVTVPTSVAAQTHPSAYDTPTTSHSGAEAMVDLVNAHRVANNAKELIHDVGFSDRTEPYGVGLASQFPPPEPDPGWLFKCPSVTSDGGFKHDTSRSIWASMPAGATTWGENIAYRCGPDFDRNVTGAFESLSRSPGHNQNMLNPEFTHIAVVVVHYGNSTFVVQRFATVPGGGEPDVVAPAPTVRAAESCLAGRGRVDAHVTNNGTETTTFSVRITGTKGFSTTRLIGALPGQTSRVSVTGRFDGEHNIEVRPRTDPGADPVRASATVDCTTGDITRPVVVTDSCLQDNGRIDVLVANNTTTTKTYVVDVQSGSVRDRSVTLGPGEMERVTVTGRPDGDIPVTVTLDGALIHRSVAEIACD